MSACHLAVVVSGFPRRSETFAIYELLALEARGMIAGIFATKAGDDGPHHPGLERLASRVEWLPEAPAEEQGRVLARRLESRRPSAIHAYFAHTPAEVAEHAARLLSVPFGFSVHARDARKVTPATLRDRASRAACVVACNVDVAGDLTRLGARVHVVPHGVDLARFIVAPEPVTPPVRLLAVGRLVNKKGFDVLIEALPALGSSIVVRIIGDGSERARLESLARDLGLASRVAFAGTRTHAELPAEYAAANLVVVPSVVDASGDRDGLPNVVLEAMASGRAVIGTRTGAIATAIAEGETGLVVDAGAPAALADAIASLAAAPDRRARMGRRGRRAVEREFDLAQCGDVFADLLGGAYA